MPDPSSYNEKQLLVCVSNSDGKAFQVLLERYHPVCYQVVLNLTRNKFVAEDLVQEVFLKVWLRRKRIHEVENFGGWLRTVSVHIVYNYIVRVKKDKMREEEWWQGMGLNHTVPVVTEEETYFQELLLRAVQKLSPRQQATFDLIKRQGFTREEAADKLGVSLETVKTNLERAMKSIRAYCLGKLDTPSIIVIFSLLSKKYF